MKIKLVHSSVQTQTCKGYDRYEEDTRKKLQHEIRDESVVNAICDIS